MEEGVYVHIGDEKILIQPAGDCPKVSPDSQQEAPSLCAVLASAYPNGPERRYSRWEDQLTLNRLKQTGEHCPQVIVDSFEAASFVWGGKWSAFDFMHFEYRAELFVNGGRQQLP